MEARNAIDGLSQSTISADTSDGVKRKIVAAMMGKVPESRVDEARAKIADLETWLSGISSRPEYKVQAAKKRDWRAVSVADFCRKMWGRSEWARLGRPYPVFSDGTLEAVLAPEATESSYHAAFRKFVEECAPRTEKFDAPGPFGRFLEDVFGALGIHGRGGQPLSAASALRSLKEAGKQIATK